MQVTQDYLDSLVREVGELRRTKGASSDGDHAYQAHGALSSAGWEAPPTSSSPQEAGVPPSFASLSSTGGVRNDTETTAVADDMESMTDTILCTGPLPPANGGSYFGAASTPAFLDIVQSVASRDDTEHARNLRSTGRPAYGRNQTSSETGKVLSAISIKSRLLPPRETADHLIDTYFSYVAISYTVLHEATFREEYGLLWDPGSPQPDSIWFCIANGIFALASLFSDRLVAQESECTAQMFFSQAKELYDFENLDYGSLSMVQALLLMGHYLHIKRVNRCWYIFGLAIRMALSLGLQSTSINSNCGMVERESRKRCWGGCLVMDTMLATTFGRPMMIASEYYSSAEMPEAVDDVRPAATVATQAATETATTPKILLFIYRIKLCIVLHSILRTLYRAAGDDGESEFRAGDMMKLDQQLSGWIANLPAPMKMRESVEPAAEDFSHVAPGRMLYTRYLTARILLTRPALALVAKRGNNPLVAYGLSPLNHGFAFCAAEACIDTSMRLIDHIRTHLPRERKVLGAAWYNTTCVFNAALVLFVAQTVPSLRPQLSQSRHWQDCIDLMRSLAEQCSSSQACLSMLESLKSRLDQSGGRSPCKSSDGLVHGSLTQIQSRIARHRSRRDLSGLFRFPELLALGRPTRLGRLYWY